MAERLVALPATSSAMIGSSAASEEAAERAINCIWRRTKVGKASSSADNPVECEDRDTEEVAVLVQSEPGWSTDMSLRVPACMLVLRRTTPCASWTHVQLAHIRL